MNDYIVRATAANDKVRLFVSSNKNTVEAARIAHNTTPVTSAALGRLLIMASLMGSTLKNDSDIITLQIKGNGPLSTVVAVTDNKCNVKGYVGNSDIDLPLNDIGKLDVKSAVGSGTLTVIKDMGLKTPYMGQIQLISGEIGEDFTYYFAVSEQTPSAVALGVLVDTDCSIRHAGGFLLQIMPDCDDELISTIEKNVATITSITNLYDTGKTPEDIVSILFEGLEFKLLDTNPTEFKCHCNRELVEDTLITIGPKDIHDILDTDKHAELHCHFCNKDYMFTEDDLKNILNKF